MSVIQSKQCDQNAQQRVSLTIPDLQARRTAKLDSCSIVGGTLLFVIDPDRLAQPYESRPDDRDDLPQSLKLTTKFICIYCLINTPSISARSLVLTESVQLSELYVITMDASPLTLVHISRKPETECIPY